jgi:probable rRNA maturation factor
MTNQTAKPELRGRDFEIALVNEQPRHPVNQQQLCDAARAVLGDTDLESASISIAVVDDDTIHALNRQYLEHDWPTDVLSFVLERRENHLEGEIILSADTAAAAAADAGWPVTAEQLLYVIHGTLHLIDYRDKTLAEAKTMRAAEAKYLRQFGFDSPTIQEGGAVPQGTRAR